MPSLLYINLHLTACIQYDLQLNWATVLSYR